MKKILALALALCMLLALGAVAFADAAPKDGGSKLTFTTGGPAGTYYGFGGVMAGKINEVTSSNVTAITSGGSAANIDALDMGDAQLAFSQSDVLYAAYLGERTFEEPITNFSIVAPLYMEQVQIITLDPEIKTVADLAGKTVSIGAPGSGVYYNAMDIMNLYGLEENVGFKATYQSFDESAEDLKDGDIDAFFCVAGAPTPAVVDLSKTTSMRLVGLDEEHIAQLMELNPSYIPYTITADTYSGMAEDCATVAVAAVIIASNDVKDADVYNFLYGVFENLEELATIHAKANELSLEFASSFVGVPYHPGAVAYFADKGIEVPAE